MTVLDTATLVMRAQSRAQTDSAIASEFGYCDEPGWVDPYWLSLPAERGLWVWGDSEPWYPPEPEPEICDHGLSLWLCADPMWHYPPDHGY